MEIEFIARQQEGPFVTSFTFSRPQGLQFDAGDYVELAINFPGAVTGERSGDKRWMSIASSPSEDTLLFATKFSPTPSAYKQAFLSLNPGDKAFISPAIGNFNLPRRTDAILLIAAGIGITPFRSMLKDVTDNQLEHDIQLMYTARESEHIFREIITESPAIAHMHTSNDGYLTIEKIMESVPDWADRTIYLSGPQPMIEQFYSEFLARGISRGQLRLDYFPGYTSL